MGRPGLREVKVAALGNISTIATNKSNESLPTYTAPQGTNYSQDAGPVGKTVTTTTGDAGSIEFA